MRIDSVVVAVALSGLAIAMPAWAVDGVIEINQAKALAGGVTATDAPGFPVTLDASGSYRLTSNLTVPDENTRGIEIGASNLTLDLNGFAILGPTVCSGSTNQLVCAPTGSGIGIWQATTPLEAVTVRNGSVRGMGNQGVYLSGGLPAASFRVEGVHALSNGGTGIYVYSGTVEGCSSRSNGGDGIVASSSIVVRNRVENNKGTGITAFSHSVVRENLAHANGSIGIYVEGSAIGNSALSNVSQGIQTLANSAVIDNVVRLNGGAGISANFASRVHGNTVATNGGVGISMGSTTGYSDNVLSGNSGGTVSGGVEIGTNLCNGSTTCP